MSSLYMCRCGMSCRVRYSIEAIVDCKRRVSMVEQWYPRFEVGATRALHTVGVDVTEHHNHGREAQRVERLTCVITVQEKKASRCSGEKEGEGERQVVSQL